MTLVPEDTLRNLEEKFHSKNISTRFHHPEDDRYVTILKITEVRQKLKGICSMSLFYQSEAFLRELFNESQKEGQIFIAPLRLHIVANSPLTDAGTIKTTSQVKNFLMKNTDGMIVDVVNITHGVVGRKVRDIMGKVELNNE